MTNSIKSVTLASIGIAALNVLTAATVHASSFDVGAQPAVLTGHSEGDGVIGSIQNTAKTATLTARCTTASFEGTTQSLTFEEATVTPTYGTGKGVFAEAQGCTVGGIKAQVLVNGCKFTFTGAGQSARTILFDIVGCTSGKQIEYQIAAGGCGLRFGEQNGLAHIVSNQLNSHELTLETTVTGLQVQQVGGATCVDGVTSHTGTGFTLSGSTVVKAFEDKGTSQVTKHQHQYIEHICGAQVKIQAT